MGRFRSAPGAKYFDSLDLYREGALRNGTPETTLFEIVDQIDQQGRLPWLTFVLGSGCLAPTESGQGPTDESIIEAIKKGFGALDLEVDAVTEARVLTFVNALVAKKLPDTIGAHWIHARSQSTDSKTVPWGIAVAASLVAAVATSEFASLMSEGSYIVDRADKEVIRIPTDLDISTFIGCLKGVQQALAGYRGGGQQGVVAYDTLLKSVQSGLESATKPELWRSQVEALTGFAWHFITDGTSIYPGWADMLLFQAATSSLNRNEFGRVPFLRRPVVENAKPLEDNSLLLERLRRVTRRSLEGDDGARDDFYLRVAQVLLQQARARSRGGSQLPLATAFTASFDIELELALWESIGAVEGPIQSFAIVTPVYVVDPGGGRGAFNTELHWLWRQVTPGLGGTPEDLIDRQEGTSGSSALGPWQRIDPTKRQLDPVMQSVPIVIHLSGAPLLEMGADVIGLFDRPVSRVHHALLLDEHLATVQFAEDLLDSPGPGQLHGEFLRSSTSQNGLAAPRFWAFIGTQLADPAIRFRLIANELRALRAPDQQNQKAELSQSFAIGEEHGGVVINDWVPAAEREVFRWFGYDIVRGKAQDLLPDLDDFLEQSGSRVVQHQGVAANGTA